MEVTPEQQHALFALLRKNIQDRLKILHLTYLNVQLGPGAKKGEALLGKLLQICVNAKNKGMQTSVNLMAKFAVNIPYFKYDTTIRDIYQREITMYEKVFSRFSHLQTDISKPFIGYPEYHSSSLENEAEYILMSDLKYEGFQTCNRIKPLDYSHMMLVMKEYARFHALSFALRQREPNVFAEICTDFEKPLYPTVEEIEENYVEIHWERALRTLNLQTHKDVLEKYQGVEKKFFRRMLDATKMEKAKEFGVICHGEALITNLLFKYSQGRSNKTPTEMSLVDFQMAKISSPAVDLSCVLLTCTDKALRDQHYLELLQEYHKHLIDFGKELETEIDFPINSLQEHMKEFSIYGLYMAITSLYLQMSSDDDIPTTGVILGITDAVRHFNHPCSNKDAYQIRIRDILIDYHTFGYNL